MLHVDSEFMLSDMENSMDTMPGTPLSKCVVDGDVDEQGDSNHPPPSVNRRERRIKTDTMLSRVSSFASLNEAVTLEDIYEYDWADSDSESPNSKHMKDSYVVQEMLADFLKIKSFKRKYPDLIRRAMDAYERSWLHQEGLVPAGRAELGLTAIRTNDVMQLLQSDYPEVHTALSDLFRRRRFEQAAELQKRQYEAARIERGGARAEAARRRALDSVTEFNHHLVTERLNNRRCYWDLQTMQIHVPTRSYKLMEPRPHPHGAYPVAIISGQFAEHFEKYTPEQLKHLPLSRSLFTKPCHHPKQPPPLPTNLRFGSVEPRPVAVVVAPENGEREQLQEQRNNMEDDRTKQDDVSDPTTEPLNGQQVGKPAGTSSPLTASTTTNLSIQKCPPDHDDDSATVTLKEPCMVCKQSTAAFIKCSECGHTGHPNCLGISDSMLPGVKSYSWACMECKRCTECADSGHEDQMMFCDLCDRGYHAFCVGLDAIPDGSWECSLCAKQPSSRKRPRATGKSSNRKSTKKRIHVGRGKASSDSDFEPHKEKRSGRKKQRVPGRKPKTPSAHSDADDTSLRRKRGRPRLTDEEKMARKMARSPPLKKSKNKAHDELTSSLSSPADADLPDSKTVKPSSPVEDATDSLPSSPKPSADSPVTTSA